MKIQVLRKRLFWYVRLVAPNNKIRLSSETYFSKSNAVRAGRDLAEDTSWKLEIK